ncbi:alpha,alpha-phosphotrehalase [Candidatus Agathobaculum pullicola]|uniref:alpha,alpha-phosphotrehalase n=1 Tax=Candidatus Agathobaculum pullicola TaxID=2838426 RepID=UPI003F90972A
MFDFHKSVVYQCYFKSFFDADGDGIGDLSGVTSKLDYLKMLGVDYIWLNPFFPSPQRDNGYDVADYCAVDPRFGTMEEFETLSREAAQRGIRLMLDMVFNHTSTEHEWFQKAMAGDKEYEDFYIWREGGPNGTPPNNWESKFGGSAWKYVPAKGKWYLHLFDPTQADLNWENPRVRKELQNVIRFWMGKGVKGFRFDVVNLISKGSYESDNEGDGRRFYTDGPRVHEFLHELSAATFGTDTEIITVGEMSSTSMENCFRYAGADMGELSMVFSFHHLKVDFVGNEKWVLVPFDFGKLKNILFSWQTGMSEHNAWNAVFWCNHDQPRVVSRFGDEGEYWAQSAKMLGTVIHCLRGTPYVYQGEEIGMTNAGFTSLDQYRDVESINHYHILKARGLHEDSVYDILRVHSRDNARTPMQWDATPHGGFTTAEPWLSVTPNYTRINAAAQVDDPDSVFSHYRRLIALRKQYDAVAYGDFAPLDETHPSVLAYTRRFHSEQLVVVNNFYRTEVDWNCPVDLDGFTCLLSNYADSSVQTKLHLRPYESLVLYRTAKQ